MASGLLLTAKGKTWPEETQLVPEVTHKTGLRGLGFASAWCFRRFRKYSSPDWLLSKYHVTHLLRQPDTGLFDEEFRGIRRLVQLVADGTGHVLGDFLHGLGIAR